MDISETCPFGPAHWTADECPRHLLWTWEAEADMDSDLPETPTEQLQQHVHRGGLFWKLAHGL